MDLVHVEEQKSLLVQVIDEGLVVARQPSQRLVGRRGTDEADHHLLARLLDVPPCPVDDVAAGGKAVLPLEPLDPGGAALIGGLVDREHFENLGETVEFFPIALHREAVHAVKHDHQVVAQALDHEFGVAHAVEGVRHRQQAVALDEAAGIEIHLDVRPEVAVEHEAVVVVPDPVRRGVPGTHHRAAVVVTPDVEDDILGAQVALLGAQEPPVGLVGAEAAHAEVAHRLAQVSGQVLLPGLAVADLVALSERIAVGVEAAWPAGIHPGGALAVVLAGGDGPAVVDTVPWQGAAEGVAHLAVEPGPGRHLGVEEVVDGLAGNGGRAKKLLVADHR